MGGKPRKTGILAEERGMGALGRQIEVPDRGDEGEALRSKS